MSSKPRRPERAPGSSAPKSLEVDLGRYQTPVAGFADGCVVHELEDVVECIFFEGRQPASPLQVARFFLSYVDLVNVWGQSAPFLTRLEAMVDRPSWGEYEILTVPPKGLELATTPAALCSMISMAKIGTTALIECYYLTATSVVRASGAGGGGRSGKLNVVPLFGVQMPAGLVLSFVGKLKSVAETHPKSPSRT